jgi:hypothetical protein
MPTNPTPEPTTLAPTTWAQCGVTPGGYTPVDFRDLPYWLDCRNLVITSMRIVGERDGRLWIEAETRSNTATASDGGHDAPGDAPVQPRQTGRGGTP